jgi:predicted DCC family thiol-disulfide oxidoreductase YuxK
MSKLIVVIDGECQFCQFSSRLLRKIIAADMIFLNQNDLKVIELEKQFPSDNWAIESIKLLSDSRVFVKSEAIRLLMREARFVFQPLRIIFILPTSVLNWAYDWVASNRYFWNKACAITSPGDKV